MGLAETETETKTKKETHGRQEGYKCGIGRRPCKATWIVWCIQRLITHSREAAYSSYNILGQHTLNVCLSGVWQDLSGLCI